MQSTCFLMFRRWCNVNGKDDVMMMILFFDVWNRALLTLLFNRMRDSLSQRTGANSGAHSES